MGPVLTPGSRTLWSHVSFWAGAVGYFLLLIVLEMLLRTPMARGWVEQQSGGLLEPVFNNYAGYDVTGAVIRELGGALFYAMLVIGFIASLILWPIRRPMALGVFSAVTLLLGLMLLYHSYGELGVERYYFSRIGSSIP